MLWGLQFSFLAPALTLLLVTLYGVPMAEVGWVIVAYQIAGFLAQLAIPAWADRRGDYLLPMLLAGLSTIALTIALWLATSLSLALAALIVFGAPAGAGSSMLFAELKHQGATLPEVTQVRAVFSFAWMVGPPVATLVIGSFGPRWLLVAIALVAACNLALTLAMMRRRTRAASPEPVLQKPSGAAPRRLPVGLALLALSLTGASNTTAVAVITLFVTDHLHAAPLWAGLALGLCATLEIPVLVASGRIGMDRSKFAMVTVGALLALVYYLGVIATNAPWMLLLLQVPNAVFIALSEGMGLAWVQEIVEAPGMGSGLFMNTRRIGAIGSGAVIALGSSGSAGIAGVFVVCAVLAAASLVLLLVAGRMLARG